MGRAALIAAAGGLFALLGYLFDATPVGALAWCAALFVACVGSGGAFARVIRERSRNRAPGAVLREADSAAPMLRMADEFGRTIINVPIGSFPDDVDDARD